MAGKNGNKKKKKSKFAKAQSNANGSKNKRQPGKSGASTQKVRRVRRKRSARYAADIFTEAAMENAYSTCHNVQDLLRWRGFPWPAGQKAKKKGGRK